MLRALIEIDALLEPLRGAAAELEVTAAVELPLERREVLQREETPR